ncbi:MAG: hypothetical protein K9M49_08040 [Candidatus Marinimicrobia bacterium]|nr:hypothetical protein [Candidatus Neomarinimicrobiota bacterium]MCF7850131.1 hypothetical protein [Candidatus Neomarinimicrobiota bacterium]MCF7905090.1 hypothetical protein [Candidatus Neomarinimicrobiota bacterium]
MKRADRDILIYRAPWKVALSANKMMLLAAVIISFVAMAEKRRRKQRKKSKRFKNSLLNEFRQEVLIGIFFLLGIFLVVEDLDIKVAVYHGIISAFQWVVQLFNRMVQGIMDIFQTVEGSDIVGYLLILMAITLFSLRVRNKAIDRYNELIVCPECGSDLHMVHRNWFQRLIGKLFFMKIRRYHCKSCEFDGLRLRSSKSR